MNRLRRAADPKEVKAKVLRTCDDRFYWVKAEGVTRSALLADVAAARPGRGVSPMTLEARITPGNTVQVEGGAARIFLRLNGALIVGWNAASADPSGHADMVPYAPPGTTRPTTGTIPP